LPQSNPDVWSGVQLRRQRADVLAELAVGEVGFLRRNQGGAIVGAGNHFVQGFVGHRGTGLQAREEENSKPEIRNSK
jgi:hypothetical protein